MADTFAPDVRALKDWLRNRVDDGVHCPGCGQFAKVYRRKIHGAMARDLIRFQQAGKIGEYLHLRTVLGHDGGDFAKLVYWGLILEADETRGDGGRAGWWTVTPDGIAFVLDRHRVPKYARIYDGRLLNLTGEPVGITDALGKRFDYRELMEGI